ncbi:hypothetical protein EON65_52440 [archaeon]|nr:MAG: hypothetical protein EON65_52440 [archaeon]
MNKLVQDVLSVSQEFDPKTCIDQLISLISDLTHLSIQAKEMKIKHEKRESQAVDCLQGLKEVVKKQQEELRKLSKRPSTTSACTSTDDLQQLEGNKHKEVSLRLYYVYSHLVTIFYIRNWSGVSEKCND